MLKALFKRGERRERKAPGMVRRITGEDVDITFDQPVSVWGAIAEALAAQRRAKQADDLPKKRRAAP